MIRITVEEDGHPARVITAKAFLLGVITEAGKPSTVGLMGMLSAAGVIEMLRTEYVTSKILIEMAMEEQRRAATELAVAKTMPRIVQP